MNNLCLSEIVSVHTESVAKIRQGLFGQTAHGCTCIHGQHSMARRVAEHLRGSCVLQSDEVKLFVDIHHHHHHHTSIYSAPITILDHRCITESSGLSANTERQTKKKCVLSRFLKRPQDGDST